MEDVTTTSTTATEDFNKLPELLVNCISESDVATESLIDRHSKLEPLVGGVI